MTTPTQTAERIEHRVHFDNPGAAEEAAKTLRNDGLDVSLEHSEEGEWILRVGAPADTDRGPGVRRIAERFGGDYDGWEIRLVSG